MLPGRGHGHVGGRRLGLLRPQPGGPAGEHVARAGRGQSGVACRVDVRRLAGGRDHAARPLEQHRRTGVGGQLPGRREAIPLHLGRACLQQSRGLQRMRREQRGPPARGACAQQRLQRRVDGEGVQRIGVEHQPPRMRQQRRQRSTHRLAAPAAADHRALRQQRRRRLPPGRSCHQLRPRGVERGRLRVEQAAVDAAGAGGQGGAGRQPRGAHHARRAADHGHVAETALVRGMPPRPPRRRPAQPGRRCIRRHAQRIEPEFTGVVATVARAAAGLERQQRQRDAGAHGGRAEQGAGVGVQAGGQVDSQHRRPLFVDGRDGGRDQALRRTRCADAEQGVDAQVGLVPVEAANVDGHAGLLRIAQRLRGVGRQAIRIGQQTDMDRHAGRAQVARRDQAVAPVVARAGQHMHPPCLRRPGHGQPGDGQAGVRHQQMRSVQCQGRVFGSA